jgi:hypothetical protein
MVQFTKIFMAVGALMASTVMAVPTPATSSAAPVTSSASTACFNALNKDLTAVNSSMATLQTALDNYDGSIWDILELLGITGDTLSVEGGLKQTDKDAQNCAGLDESDTLALATPFANLLPFIQTLLNTLVEKKNDFDHAILYFGSASPIVGDLTSQLKSTFDDVITTIEGLVPSTFEPIIAQLGTQVDGWFTTTINAYAGSSFINLEK